MCSEFIGAQRGCAKTHTCQRQRRSCAARCVCDIDLLARRRESVSGRAPKVRPRCAVCRAG
eukprot:360406-Chlamydomonas_euryale.AAC.3